MTGTFAITFDTELIWGSFDHTPPETFVRRYGDVRTTLRAVIGLLERYEIPATWAVVGHLFLSECRRDERGVAHPELVHPRQSRYHGDWFAADPCTDMRRNPLWYGADIVDAIEAASTRQEIGCHSFSHPRFDDPALTEEAVRSDLAACVRLATDRGIRLRSFVFPRNEEGHHELLREAGFHAFRGAEPRWYARLPVTAARAGHLLDQAAGVPPPVTFPTEQLPGLWNIPASAFLIHRSGPRRMIPIASRMAKARSGLNRATASGSVFHLWTHVFNLSSDPAYMLGLLEAILKGAAEARSRGTLLIESMGTIADRLAAGRGMDAAAEEHAAVELSRGGRE